MTALSIRDLHAGYDIWNAIDCSVIFAHCDRLENVVDFGPIKVQADVKERHSVPPLVSWAVLGSGLVVLVFGLKKK